MTLNLDETSLVTFENRLLIYFLVIWVCLSDILFTIRRQAVGSRNTSTCHVTNGHLLASTRVRGRALAMLTPARWPYEKVISKRDMLVSVLSYVSVDGFLSRHNIRSRPSVPVRD